MVLPPLTEFVRNWGFWTSECISLNCCHNWIPTLVNMGLTVTSQVPQPTCFSKLSVHITKYIYLWNPDHSKLLTKVASAAMKVLSSSFPHFKCFSFVGISWFSIWGCFETSAKKQCFSLRKFKQCNCKPYLASSFKLYLKVYLISSKSHFIAFHINTR